MSMVMFDTLKLVQRLRDKAKFTPEQAEETASALADTFAEWTASQPTATKADVDSVRLALREESGALRGEVGGVRNDLEALKIEAKTSLAALEMKLSSRIEELELRMTIRLGSMIVALGGVLVAIKYFG